MDLHTLHVEHAALLGLFTLLTIANSALHRGGGGSRWFPAFTFCAFLGAILISLRATLSHGSMIVIGDLSFSIAYVFLSRSLIEYFGVKTRLGWLQGGLTGLCALVLLQTSIAKPDTRTRLFLYSLILAVQVGSIAWHTMRNASGFTRWSSRLMGGLLIVLSANNLLRAIAVMVIGAPQDYLRGGNALSTALLITTVLQGGVTIAFVWMTAARLQGALEKEAMTDPLTRLMNRRAMAIEAEREFNMNRRTNLPLSAILIDLDEFKTVNDVWGHHCGDAMLLAVARCLEGEMRSGDRLARLGGDEFAVLLPRTSRYEAQDIAERLRASIEEMRCVSGEAVMQVHASFGVAQMDEVVMGWEQLIQQCDKAMYRVKAQGGNQVLVH